MKLRRKEEDVVICLTMRDDGIHAKKKSQDKSESTKKEQ